MKGTLTKVGLGVATVLAGGLAPVIPSDMTLKYSYQYPVTADRTDYRLETSSTTGESILVNHGMLPDADFTDDDGNGIISVSVFQDINGNAVYIPIPDSEYADMGKVSGELANPQKAEYLNIFEALTAQPAQASIAVDTTAENWVNASSMTFSYTITGSNTALMASFFSFAGGDACTGVTWNGSALTQRGKIGADAGGEQYLYGKATTDTGTHNIVISYSTTVQIFATFTSYTGVDQTTPFPDTATTGSGSASSFSPTVTTSVDQSWVITGARSPSKAPTAGANTTVRKLNTTSGDAGWTLDSNGGRSTGSNAMNWSYTGASFSYYIVTSLAPSVASTPAEATTTIHTQMSGSLQVGGAIMIK